MLNKLHSFVREHRLISPGDHIICAVSGGADSVALLFSMYLLKEKLEIQLSAAHFNHHLRGEESNRDENFVRDFCARYEIPLIVGEGTVVPGKKGLEAAARDARYGFLRSLPGKIATAHTADDNAETVLMHLVRGTGLKGLGGIAPVNGNVIRPMLAVTRQNVEGFLREWCLDCVEDSSNRTDAFLRNRLRHHVMPLLKQENPALAENVSAMALLLRQDADYLEKTAESAAPEVEALREAHPAIRSRCLTAFLKSAGVPEPEKVHIALAEKLVFSDNPSARAALPGGITVARNYDRLVVILQEAALETVELPCPGSIRLKDVTVACEFCDEELLTTDSFTVSSSGPLHIRSRRPGDSIRLSGGAKSLKKLFIDRKIPAHMRHQIPVITDSRGILGVWGIGANLDRVGPGIKITFMRENQRNAEK